MIINPQEQVMQKCCPVVTVTTTGYLFDDERGLFVEVRKEDELIDPYFLEATIAIKDVLGDDYSVIKSLESVTPSRDSLGIYTLPPLPSYLTSNIGEYMIIWSVRETPDSPLLGYERVYSVVRER